MPPQSVPLYHKDYLELKTTEKQQTPKKHSAFTRYLPKRAEHNFPFVKVFPSPVSGRGGPRNATLKVLIARDNSRLLAALQWHQEVST